jgi:adenylate kinase
VVSFDLSEDMLVERLAGRVSCTKCGAVYNTKTNPPTKRGTCDRCGAAGLQVRADDRPEAVRERLRVYGELTEPLQRYYEERGLLVRIDASRDVEAVFQELLRLFS